MRVLWSIDDDGNMTPVNSVLLAKVVTLQVEVPQGTRLTCCTRTKVQTLTAEVSAGHPAGAPVVVMHEGKEVRVCQLYF